MINYLKEIFKALNDAKINYAVLRGYETLPYKISHDIDFGVDVNDLKQMTEILVNVSDKFNYKKVYQSKRKGIVQFYFYYNNNCLKLDLWTDFSYKGLQYLDMDIVLRQIKIHNDIKVLNEETEVLISFLKEFLHNGWIRKDKLEILKEIIPHRLDCPKYLVLFLIPNS